MTHRRTSTIAATTLLVIGTTISLTGATSGVAVADAPARHAAAASWESASSARASERDAELLATLAESLDGGKLADAREGRSIQVDQSTRIAAVPTSTGALCSLYEVGGVVVSRGCGEGFAADGTAVSYTIEGDGRVTLRGLVASDVSKLSLTTSDGTEHDVRIVDGAVAWSGSARTPVVRMTTVRGGVETSEEARFVTPAS